MKKRLTFIALSIICSLFVLNTVRAQDRTFGIGGMIGDPDGISAKAWLSESMAIAGGLSFNLGENFSWFSIHADFLKQNTLAVWEEALLQSHFGGGIRVGAGDFSDFVALRGPIGVDVNAIDAPVEVFMEVVPTLNIDPVINFYFSGTVGFRYYFGD